MKKRTGIRMGMALFILMLALGVAGFPGQDADAATYCTAYTSCEHNCMPREEACLAGTLNPECGGDWYCCNQKLSRCWDCCIWY